MNTLQKGFTLIELMIVIAILGILMAIAIPAYNDYTVRAKVSECVNALAPLKTGVSEYFLSNGVIPSTLASVGTSAATAQCTAATLAAGGVITITSAVVGAPGTVAIRLTPTTTATGVTWLCTAIGSAKFAPSSCR